MGKESSARMDGSARVKGALASPLPASPSTGLVEAGPPGSEISSLEVHLPLFDSMFLGGYALPPSATCSSPIRAIPPTMEATGRPTLRESGARGHWVLQVEWMKPVEGAAPNKAPSQALVQGVVVVALWDDSVSRSSYGQLLASREPPWRSGYGNSEAKGLSEGPAMASFKCFGTSSTIGEISVIGAGNLMVVGWTERLLEQGSTSC